MAVEEGKPAPDFELTSDSGERVKLSDFRGKPVVLYFYPKSDTPGCTAQACGIRDSFADFEQAGAVVLGVSADKEAAQAKFSRSTSCRFRSWPTPTTSPARRTAWRSRTAATSSARRS